MEIDKEFNNSFELQLKEAEYKIHEDRLKKAMRLFQKRYTDDIGIKYFINIYHYNHSRQLPSLGINIPDEDSYNCEAQFTIDNKGKENIVNIDFSGNFADNNEYRATSALKDVEEFFDKVWKSLGVNYCKKWD